MSSMYFYLFLLLCNRVSHADDISLFYFILSTIFQASFVDMDEDFLGPGNFDGQQAFNLLKVSDCEHLPDFIASKLTL